MVNVLKGVLIECDPAMKQFLLYLDESNALGKKFIIQDLDETHVFVLAELVNFLQERVGELMDQNSFPITQNKPQILYSVNSGNERFPSTFPPICLNPDLDELPEEIRLKQGLTFM
ncbi:general transcription factor IIH subunit 5 [Alligator mississippiensis]|uniref:General transcription and DNA repair factor IIH subunit TFB5 n=1 Tax=Alligator mississippiensis TaxID=8496 RepID=A0A151M2E2_ALLMI|nr:general transcription factor IIH subunit 5 [Alligator mississippiensis]